MKPKSGSFVVSYPCAAQCCDVVITTVTTTPLGTVTTTPMVPVTTPASPCAPTYMLYASEDAAAAKTGALAETDAPVPKPIGHWSLAFCSVFGLLTCSALTSIVVSNRQSSRDIRPVQPRFFDGVDGMEDAYADENQRLLACDVDDIEEAME